MQVRIKRSWIAGACSITLGLLGTFAAGLLVIYLMDFVWEKFAWLIGLIGWVIVYYSALWVENRIKYPSEY
jgi:hypothetical protein